jgi:hypothetical protein
MTRTMRAWRKVHAYMRSANMPRRSIGCLGHRHCWTVNYDDRCVLTPWRRAICWRACSADCDLVCERLLGANSTCLGSIPSRCARVGGRHSACVHCLFDTAPPECGYVEIRLFILRALYVLHHKGSFLIQIKNVLRNSLGLPIGLTPLQHLQHRPIPTTPRPTSTRRQYKRGAGRMDAETPVGTTRRSVRGCRLSRPRRAPVQPRHHHDTPTAPWYREARVVQYGVGRGRWVQKAR